MVSLSENYGAIANIVRVQKMPEYYLQIVVETREIVGCNVGDLTDSSTQKLCYSFA